MKKRRGTIIAIVIAWAAFLLIIAVSYFDRPPPSETTLKSLGLKQKEESPEKIARALLIRAFEKGKHIEDPANSMSILISVSTVSRKVDPELSMKALGHAEKVMGRIRDAETRAENQQYLAVAYSFIDPERAIALARDIDSQYYRAYTFTSLLDGLTETAPDLAPAIAQEAIAEARQLRLEAEPSKGEDEYDKEYRAFNFVVQFVGEHFPDEALRICEQEVPQDKQTWIKVLAARAIAKTDLERALKLVSTFEPSTQGSALSYISRNIVADDTDKALEIANSIDDAWRRGGALLDIAQEIAAQDPALAKEIALQAREISHTLEDEVRRSMHDSSAGRLVARTDPEEALLIAESIADPIWKACLLSDISKALAKSDPARARKLAYETLEIANKQDPNSLNGELSISAAFDALIFTDLPKAFSLMEDNKDLIDDTHLVYILSDVLEYNPTLAPQIVEKIESDYWQSSALSKLARAAAKDDLSEALEIAAKAPDLLGDAFILWSIADEILKESSAGDPADAAPARREAIINQG